jgi:hypothetical protein
MTAAIPTYLIWLLPWATLLLILGARHRSIRVCAMAGTLALCAGCGGNMTTSSGGGRHARRDLHNHHNWYRTESIRHCNSIFDRAMTRPLLLYFSSVTAAFFGPLFERRILRLIGDRVELALSQVKTLHLLAIKRPRTAPSKNGQLVAGFIHSSIAVDSP